MFDAVNFGPTVTTDTTSLCLFQKILLTTDGTVTDLIALYTNETIRVKKIKQEIHTAVAPVRLACDGPTAFLSRQILLCGSVQNYLFADSLFVFERFSPEIQEQLLNTDRPIGLLWKQAHLETYREIVDQRIESCAAIAQYFELAPSAQFMARTYLIHHNGKPLGVITEKWPCCYFRDG